MPGLCGLNIKTTKKIILYLSKEKKIIVLTFTERNVIFILFYKRVSFFCLLRSRLPLNRVGPTIIGKFDIGPGKV